MNIGDIKREVLRLCKEYGLEHDCGPDGDANARIAFIGEAPGDKERMLKMPLCGASGSLLWDVMRPHGITRRIAYLTNVSKRQLLTTSEKYSKNTMSDGELDLYSSILAWELGKLPNVEVVVCLGTRALTAVTGLPSADMYRGSVLTSRLQSGREVKVVVLNNPAAVLRQPSRELMFRFDCKRVADVFHGRHESYEIKSHINPTFAAAIAWIDRMQSEGRPVSLDIEVASGEIICIGLANDGHEGMCIPFRTERDNYWTHEQEVKLWLRISELVQDPNVRLVMQNGMYDASMLWYKNRVRIKSFWFDTMLAHHTLYPSLPHGLGFLCTQYTTHPYYKEEGKAWREGGTIEQEWEYNVKDICITWSVHAALLKELEEQGLDRFFFGHVMRLQPHLVEMTVLGVKRDPVRQAELAVNLRTAIQEYEREFYDAVFVATQDPDYRPNYKSPKQLAELLFKRLKLVGRGVATDEENRRRMREHPRTDDNSKRILDAIDALAKHNKLLGTYVNTEIDDDGRIRTQYQQTGVQSAPGRLSSTGTGWGTGGNLQNQPPVAAEMFIADDGLEFSYFDLAQAEARTVAWRYGIAEWMEQFEKARLEGSGFDSHRALAAKMFNVPYEEVPKTDYDENGQHTIRYTAKRCRHALNYRLMADGLATQLRIPLVEAEFLWSAYHRATPEIMKGWEAELRTVQTTRMLHNAYGRRWILLEKYSYEATQPCIAFYHQSTIGDKVARCIYLCHEDPEWPHGRARIALNVHDSLTAINDPEVGDLVRRIMKKHAEEPLLVTDIHGTQRELIIPADLKKSKPDELGIHRWSSLEKL